MGGKSFKIRAFKINTAWFSVCMISTQLDEKSKFG